MQSQLHFGRGRFVFIAVTVAVAIAVTGCTTANTAPGADATPEVSAPTRGEPATEAAGTERAHEGECQLPESTDYGWDRDERERYVEDLAIEMHLLSLEYVTRHEIPVAEAEWDVIDDHLATALTEAGCGDYRSGPEWYNEGHSAMWRALTQERPIIAAEEPCPLPVYEGDTAAWRVPSSDDPADEAYMTSVVQTMAVPADEWLRAQSGITWENRNSFVSDHYKEFVAGLGCSTDWKATHSAEAWLSAAKDLLWELSAEMYPAPPPTGGSGGEPPSVDVPNINVPDLNPFSCSWSLRGGVNCGLRG